METGENELSLIESKESWLALERERSLAGASVNQFLRERGIKEHSYYSWKRKLKLAAGTASKDTSPQKGSFTELANSLPPQPLNIEPWAIELTPASGTVVKIRG